MRNVKESLVAKVYMEYIIYNYYYQESQNGFPGAKEYTHTSHRRI